MAESYGRVPIIALLIPFGMVSLSTGGSFFAPIYPSILHEYEAYPFWVPLTLSLFLFGKSISGLFYGFLSDAYGRRNIIFLGMGLFMAGSAIAALDLGIGSIVFSRFIQGVGSSVAGIVGIAIVNDLYRGKMVARIIARASNVSVLVSSLLPLAAGYLAATGIWEYDFIAMLIMSLFAVLVYARYIPESLPPERRMNLKFEEFKRTLKYMLKDAHFVIFLTVCVLTNIGVQTFYALAPIVLVEHLNVPIEHFTYYILWGSLCFVVGSVANHILIRWIRIGTIIVVGFVIFTCGGFILYWGIHNYSESAHLQRLCMAPSAFGLGFIVTNSISFALKNLRRGQGLASSLLDSVASLVSAIAIFLLNLVEPTSFFPIAYMYIATGLLGLLILYHSRDLLRE